MTDCVIVQPIESCGVRLLKDAGLSVFEAPIPELKIFKSHLMSARAIITRNLGLSDEAINLAPNLEIIASHGTGTDTINQVAASKRNIKIVNTAGSNAKSVAEHALALMLACAHQIPLADQSIRSGSWSFREELRIKEISSLQLGLIGYGHVARELGLLARGLGMTVSVYSQNISKSELSKNGLLLSNSLEALLAGCNVISLHGVPGCAPRLNRNLLQNLNKDSIIINTARGALLDEAALAELLHEGKIRAAGLDVFSEEPLPQESPLFDCPNLIMTPHIGGSSVKALENTANLVAQKVIDALKTTPSKRY